ncbi:unnamed protein product [Periconia digitata]|uniref:NAD(P)-binding protein n=1 Tax=Periconia digitata TaxID=1303443 RepID=A0A9W4XMM4_9PLEO|nr:unnamed protein product [Periconia digitata]
MASNKTIVLVTGANTGIGYETIKALYASATPHTLLMGSRSLDKAHEAIKKIQSDVPESSSEIVPVQLDIEDDDSIEKSAQFVQSTYGKLDVLVNNAGASFDPVMAATPGPKALREAWNHTYSINVTSTEATTQAFAPLLVASSSTARILFITSGLSSFAHVAGGALAATARSPAIPAGWPKPAGPPSFIAYRSSKAALNMQMLEWSRVLKEDGVKVFCISPGFLATGLGGVGSEKLKAVGAADASVGGELIRDVVEGGRDADAGLVVAKDGVQKW